MILIKQKTIQEIPVLELVLKEKEKEALPTVIFYHGWTSNKEAVLVNGYELAKKGIRAILPESYLHGERDHTGKGIDSHHVFWDVISHNLQEFPLLYEHYVKEDLADPERFGASGLSMGGITTCALLTQFDFIKVAVILMGSPSPIPFTKWLLTSRWSEAYSREDMPDPNQVQTALEQLYSISLDEFPEKIAGRPVHFWHGTEDDLVPFHLTEAFIERISMHPYAQNVSFSVGHGHGHKVPYKVSVQMAEYFDKHL